MMNLQDFRRAGHWPTLLSAFLYFDISFMVWVLLGALANSIGASLDLSESEKALLAATPLLGGAILRLVLGWLTDHLGPRRTGLIGITATMAPLLLGWLWADSLPDLLLVGVLLGVAGASFAVALPLASRWYPPRYQGLALGIAGAGNSGTALATFFGPRLAEAVGWQAVLGLALIPMLFALVVFVLCAKDSPAQPPPRRLSEYAAVLRQPDTWWFCLFYSVTFGGFVGLASFLSIFFHDHYGLNRVDSGMFAALCVFGGSFLRPVGGHLADQVGGIRVLLLLYSAVGLLMLDLATLPPLAWGTVLLLSITALLGLGNGAVFQLVPQRFPKEIGVLTGVVGAAGGLGGFFLPTLLGNVKEITGSYSGGFLILSLISLGCALAIYQISPVWQGAFVSAGGCAAGEAAAVPGTRDGIVAESAN
jgi:NNP family nitrate/nitrite transporter-like MFS transporter